MIRATLLALVTLAATAATAQDDDTESFRLGDDVYTAGATVEVTGDAIANVFAAGERVDLAAAVAGSAHLAGRRVTTEAPVDGNLYAAGADVTVSAPVSGDATIAGYDVNVGAAIGGNLRAMAANVRVEAPVAGTALIAGQIVTLAAIVTGDTVIGAETIDFGDAARIDGRLILYGEEGEMPDVPERVVPPDRIERRAVGDDISLMDMRRPGPTALVGGFLGGILVVALLTSLVAAIAPQRLERLRDLVRARPLRSFWIGFLALSALLGASVLLVLTLIGIFVAPAVIVAAVVLGFIGYLVAVYLVGRAFWDWIGQLPPDTLTERAIAALIGATAVALVALIPFLGWLVLMILTLVGLGGLTIAVFRPELRTDP